MQADKPDSHVVGTSVGRSDGVAKVVGTARYVDDLPKRPGELHGVTVRAPVARGTLRAVKFDPSFDWSDITVVQAADVPTNVVAVIAYDQPVLASTAINHAYEPIVLLACADRAKLARAKLAVHLDIDPLEPVLDIQTSLSDQNVVWSAPDGFGDKGTNVMKRYLITKGEADVDAELARCARVVSGTYSTHHQEQMYIEPQGVVAWWDDAGRARHGLDPVPVSTCTRPSLKAFDLAADRIDITQSVTGGGFGGKEEYPSIIALHAALLAKKSGRPVRMIYDRKEDIEATTKRHPAIVEIKSGCDATAPARPLGARDDGRRRVRDLHARRALPRLAPRGRRVPLAHVRIEAVAVATNTPPNGAFRGFGAPQTIWAIERHLDAIAAEARPRSPGSQAPERLEARRHHRDRAGAAHLRRRRRVPRGWRSRLQRYASEAREGPRRARAARRAASAARSSCTARASPARASAISRARPPGSAPGGRPAHPHRLDRHRPGHRDRVPADRRRRRGRADLLGRLRRPVHHARARLRAHGRERTVMVVGSIVEAAREEIGAAVESRAGERRRLASPRPPIACSPKGRSLAAPIRAARLRAMGRHDLQGRRLPVLRLGLRRRRGRGRSRHVRGHRGQALLVGDDVGKAINPIMCKGQLEGGTLQAIGWALCEGARPGKTATSPTRA
jgi:CO/xanthine dehydrogenase Mo-binding subunit